MPRLYAVLLDALTGAEVFQAGATIPYRFTGRFLFGSQLPLAQLYEDGTLPEDLYERMRGPEVEVWPLARRREDIPVLAEHFLGRIAEAKHLEEAAISDAAMGLLVGYSWPRNVRQLENELGIAAWRSGVAPGGSLLIEPRHLSEELLQAERRRGRPKKVSDGTVTREVQVTGSTAEVAKRLGLSRRTVQRRVKSVTG